MKSFEHAYHLSDKQLWTGLYDRQSAERYFQLVQHLDIRNNIAIDGQKSNYAILGFACDAGIKRNQGRPGAKQGPSVFRQALANLPWHHHSSVALYDCGDIYCDDDDLESAQSYLAMAIARMFELQLKPIIIGGGHELAWGHYQGIARAGLDCQLGIMNFDAHLDCRELLPHNQGSSGTSFLQIANYRQAHDQRFDYTCIGLQASANTEQLLETARQLNVHTLFADDIQLNGIEHSLAFIDDSINRADTIYVSLCLDVLSESYAPGVSAPQVMGLQPWQMIQMLRYILQSHKVISFDIAELSPPLDIDNRTARLAAVLASEYIQFS